MNRLYCAPLGTELPTDATTPFADDGFTALGYISEDGITPSHDVSVEQVKAWGDVRVEVRLNIKQTRSTA